MTLRSTLDDELRRWGGLDDDRRIVAATVLSLAGAAARISALVARGALAGDLARAVGRHGSADEQKELDVIANDWMLEALRSAPVSAFVSEEARNPIPLAAGAPLLVAADPIDGSSNIEANSAIGTIFSLLPARRGADGGVDVLQPGRNQMAAGFVVYGPATTLALTLGAGTSIYTLNRDTGRFVLVEAEVAIPPQARELAVNVSNYRHWDEVTRIWLDDCLRGTSGPRGRDFNMRWTASPVAEFQRILRRGGIFVYPGDARRGYTRGRLRLVYEANPIAFIVEQAGGAATSGTERVLDLMPAAVHEHVPLIAGAREEVEYYARLASDPRSWSESSPLFARRGLFRT